MVVAYKKLLPRDPFQEEVLIHPLFDIEFVAFTFQVQYCVIRVTYDRCLHIEVDCNIIVKDTYPCGKPTVSCCTKVSAFEERNSL